MNGAQKMADELHKLSIDDVDSITGGSIETTTDTTRLREITIEAKGSGKTLEWALQYCKTEEERTVVTRVWEGLA